MPNAWKRHELAIAKRLGGKRAGPTGRTGPDVLHPHLGIECKERHTLPKWLINAMAQCVGASATWQLPVVILHQLGQRHDDDLVVMRLADWEQWYGETHIEREN